LIDFFIASIDMILLLVLAMVAVAVIRSRSLFAAAMLTAIYSLTSAGVYVLLNAMDVAFTEAAVGAGISTVLLLAALTLTGRQEKRRARASWGALFTVLVVGSLLVYGTLDLPHYGDPNSPIHLHVAPRYLESTLDEIGIPNVVTAVLASYRGYDTLGETTVIFTAALAVMLLLGGIRERRQGE